MGIGVLFLIWIPIEDLDINYVTGLGTGISTWLALRKFYALQEYKAWKGMIISGGLWGLAVAPLTITMMVFKSGLHAHGFQDFPISQMTDVLRSTPWWGLAGLVLGGVFGRIWKIK